MKAEDILLYNPSSKKKLLESLEKELESALISYPLWGSRENSLDLKAGISDFLKNRLAHTLLGLFAEEQNLNLNFKIGEKPFPKARVHDFSYGNTAWYIQNSFLRNRISLTAEDYVYLPALIPNGSNTDAWSRRSIKPEGHEATGYLFTFLNEDLHKPKPMFDVEVEEATIRFLNTLKSQCEDGRWQKQTYSEDWFWDEFLKLGKLPCITLGKIPTLVIAGVAQEKHFGYFADTDEKANLCYRLYRGEWYKPKEDGGLSFCNGLIHTKIKNATCPMAALGSFNEVFVKKK